MAALAPGDPVPEFTVHRGTRDLVSLTELVAEGPGVFHFYVFDFTGDAEGG